MKNKKLLLLPLMALFLVGCGGGNPDPTSTSGEDTTPSSDISNTTPSSDTTDDSTVEEDDVITLAQAQTLPAETMVEVKAVVIATHTRGYLLSDNTGLIVYYTNSAPVYAIGDYLHVSGALKARYDNLQFDSTAVATLITDETLAITPTTPIAITETEWDAFNGIIGIYVTMTVQITLNGSNVNFTFGGATRVGAPQYPDASLGLTAANNGKFFTIKGWVVEKPSSAPERNNIIVTEATEEGFAAVTSVTIADPASTSLEVGKSLNLNATVAPANADPAITWSTSNENIATVSSVGQVVGVAEGSVTIRASSTADATKYDELTLTITPSATSGTTANKSIATIAADNSWTNGTQYSSFVLDSVVTVSSTGAANTGKYYTSDNSWRIYSSETGTVTISLAEGYELLSVTFTYTMSNPGYLQAENLAEVVSGTAFLCSGTAASFTAIKTGTSNANALITAIAVTYAVI